MLNTRSRRYVPLAAVMPLEARRLLASFMVSTTADDGLGSLRQAVADANASAGADTITFDTAGVFAAPKTITLTTGPLVLTDEEMTTIMGPTASLTISGNHASGIFVTQFAGLTLSHLTLTAGNSDRGGAVNNGGGNLSMIDCTVTGNTATVEGGGIDSSSGVMTLLRCTITNNTAPINGGVLVTLGNATMTDCTVSGNVSTDPTGYGGGVTSVAAKLHVLSSTISGNTSAYCGGGMGSFGGTVTVTNSTISGNSAASGGGGMAILGNNGTVTFTNSTVTRNTGGGLSKAVKPKLNINNTVVAGQVSGADVTGAFTGSNNFIGGDPMLGPLANNGGPTLTHKPLVGSPLLNAGSNALALDRLGNPLLTDQRGTGSLRIFDGVVDIGAVEFNVPPNTPPTTIGIPDATANEDGPNVTVNLRNYFNDAEDGAAGLVYTVGSDTNPALFASVVGDSAGMLTLDLAPNANGVAHITIRATDTAGAYVETTFSVTVRSAQQQQQLLQQEVQSLAGLNHGNANSLMAKLALKGNDGDTDKLTSFISSVQGMIDTGKMTAATGKDLIDAATALIVSLH